MYGANEKTEKMNIDETPLSRSLREKGPTYQKINDKYQRKCSLSLDLSGFLGRICTEYYLVFLISPTA